MSWRMLLLGTLAIPGMAVEMEPWATTEPAASRQPALPGFCAGGSLYAFYNDRETLQRADQQPDGSLSAWRDHADDAYKTKWGIPTVYVAPYVYAGGDWGRVFRARRAGDGSLSAWENAIVGGDSITNPGRGFLWGAAAVAEVEGATYIYHLCGFEYVGNWEPRFVSDCFYTRVRHDGMLEPWQATHCAPYATMSPAAVVAHNGSLVLLGGGVGTFQPDIGPVTDFVATAPVQPDGSLGPWTLQSRRLPVAVRGSLAFAAGASIVVCGGVRQGGVGEPSCWQAAVGQDGSIGAWQALPSLPAGTGMAPRGIMNGHAYMMGIDNAGPVPVYYTRYTAPPPPTPTPPQRPMVEMR